MKHSLRLAFIFCLSLLTVTWANAGTISPGEASRYIGQVVTVEGSVSEVHTDQRSGVTFINMGGRYPSNTFTGVIFSAFANQFPGVAWTCPEKVESTN